MFSDSIIRFILYVFCYISLTVIFHTTISYTFNGAVLIYQQCLMTNLFEVIVHIFSHATFSSINVFKPKSNK